MDEGGRKLWLDALHDPLTGIRSSTALMALVDLTGDGETAIAACDVRRKLKVYKGTSLLNEYALIDAPTALCVCYSHNTNAKPVPNLAVAAGSHIFVYRDMKPFKKWTCPLVDIEPEEKDVWRRVKEGREDVDSAYSALSSIRSRGSSLSSRSIEFLSLKSDTKRQDFVTSVANTELEQHSLVTCMDTLKVDSEEADALSQLVVGTEDNFVYVLSPTITTNGTNGYLTRQRLPDVPVILNASGLFHAEWRVAVLCRNGHLYSVKNGDVKGQSVISGVSIQIGSHAIAIAQQGTLLWIGTTENKVCSYTTRGQKQREILLDGPLSDICIMNIDVGGRHMDDTGALLAVSMQSGSVNIYKGTKCVDQIRVDGAVKGMLFGRYGREENSLCIIHGNNGALTVKMWRRNNKLTDLKGDSGPPKEQDVPIPVPKKTKLYLELCEREREDAAEIHRLFQRDLCVLRLEAARSYVKVLTDSNLGAARTQISSSSTSGGEEEEGANRQEPSSVPVKVAVKVEGLGPSFLMKVTLQNLGGTPLYNCRLLYSFDQSLYVMGHSANSDPAQCVPLLVPGASFVYENEVLSVDPAGRAGRVTIHLKADSDSSVPLVSAQVLMPTAEPSLLDD